MSEIQSLVGQKIGNYHIDHLLGSGKVNALYQTHHVAQNHSVMLTTFLIPATFSAQARSQFLARFHRESTPLLKLLHPHIFPLYDQGEYMGLPYHVNPLHEGTSLSKKLRIQERFTSEQALTVLRPIADALDLAHVNAVFHGSLSSSNVLLTKDDVVQVAGFGISQILVMRGIDQFGNPPYAHLLNIAGTFLSPPAYLSPEAIQGVSIDGRADIYALGILLFELLSGSPPFRGTNPADILQQHFQHPIPSLHAQIPTLPAEVDAILQKALHHQPDQRFQSASELVHAFTLSIQPTNLPSIETHQEGNYDAKLPPIQIRQPANRNHQDTLPLTVNWLTTEKYSSMQPIISPDPSSDTESSTAPTISTPQTAFTNELTADSLPGIDPFDWWHSTAQTSMVPPHTLNKSISNRSARATSSRKSKPRKQSRRRVVALFATGGVLVLGTAGVTSIILPHLLQKKISQSTASTQPSLQPRPTPQPTPNPTPTPQPTSTPNPTPTPQPTPTPIPQPQHTGTVIASTNMPANSAHNFTDPVSGNGSILVHLTSGNFVAYNRACTHEQVAVDYDPGSHQLVCPAHGATFDPANAANVTQGPADSPLARVSIRVNNDGTITTG